MATPEEELALSDAPIVLGGTVDERGRPTGGLVAYRPISHERWMERYGGPRYPQRGD